MKVFDLHIGLSDAVIQLKKDPIESGTPSARLPNQFDYFRAKRGDLDIFCGMICPVSIEGETFSLAKNQKEEIQKHINFYTTQETEKNMTIVRAAKDLNVSGLKTILGIEGVYFLEKDEDLLLLENFIKMGIRVIGPKWNFPNKLFTKTNKITSLGKSFLQLCERKKIILDLAHSESSAIETILAESNGSVIDTHTCLFEVSSNPRNIRGEFIKEIIKRDGVIGLNFVGEFVGGNNLSDVLKHFELFINNFGTNNLAIGSDFDGMEDTDLIKGLEDVSKYKNLAKALKGIDLLTEEIQMVMFQNAFDCFKKEL